jgi:tyrosine-specific transport protein
VELPNLRTGEVRYLPSAIMVMVTAFGFATIIPSLRTYFKSDMKKLRQIVIIGSFVPLLCYITWDLAILGSLPASGNNSLLHILNSGHVTSELMIALQQVIHKNDITQLSRLFTSICVLTSFLGVALCLFDFLADGFKIPSHWYGRIVIAALTFAPPLVVVLFFPGAFIHALNYAGMCCVILLVLLPTMMVWRGTTKQQRNTEWRLLSNRWVISIVFLIGVGLLALGTYQTFNLI